MTGSHEVDLTDEGTSMPLPTECRVVGAWRIIGSDSWDHDYLDLVEPARMLIHRDGSGEIPFGAMQATIDVEYARSTIFFTWVGFDEGDEVRGTGSAELLHDGFLEIELAYHLGEEAVLKAVRS